MKNIQSFSISIMFDVEDKVFRLGGNTVGKSVKLSDIANELGVSIVTVSNALSHRKGVSEELREKIQAKADKLGYIRNTKASEEKKETYNVGVVVSERYLEKGHMAVSLPNIMPTAFVCNCDLAAELLIEQLTLKGYDVPEDISVVGYDNFSYSSYINKNLTTYDVDTDHLARQCFHVLVKRIKNTNGHMGIQNVEGSMIIRNSVSKIY